jgi:Domain of unknown function (DUF4468) with TBP-like fold
MRKLFASLFILGFVLTTTAQEKLKDILPLKNGKVTYSGVIQVDSLSQEEIYARARSWLAYNYEYSKLDDKGELINKGYFQYGIYRVWNTITIKIKSGRYKYEISDFKMDEKGTEYDLEGSYGSLTKKADFNYIDKHINEIIPSLEAAIKTEPAKEDNW